MPRPTPTTRRASAAAEHPPWRARFQLTVAVLAGLLASCDAYCGKDSGCTDGCKKKPKAEKPLPPDEGAATQDEVNTGIGKGIGFGTSLAPTSTQWERVVVVDDRTAVVWGRSLDEAIAIRTTDGGRNWETFRAKVGNFAGWGVGTDGAAILAAGDRRKDKPQPGKLAAVETARMWFAPRDRNLSEAAPLFGGEAKLKDVVIESGVGIPAVLSPEIGSVVADQGKAASLVFGAPGGQPQPAPIAAGGTRLVAAPYGRPAMLLSESRGTIEVRPWPKPGGKVEGGSKLSLPNISNAFEQLGAGPGCELGAYSFQRVASGAANAWIVGVSPQKSFTFQAPKGDEQRIGCGADAVVVETFDDVKKVPRLVRCTFDGKCSEPRSQPFEIWPVKHDRKIRTAATKRGVVAVMTARAGARWGTYLGVSTDKGATFGLPRMIGEGVTDRGFFDVGALISFPDRVVILLTADVTGTRRRGWFALATEDGGDNWGPP
jgi:hypothetical protein